VATASEWRRQAATGVGRRLLMMSCGDQQQAARPVQEKEEDRLGKG